MVRFLIDRFLEGLLEYDDTNRLPVHLAVTCQGDYHLKVSKLSLDRKSRGLLTRMEDGASHCI